MLCTSLLHTFSCYFCILFIILGITPCSYVSLFYSPYVSCALSNTLHILICLIPVIVNCTVYN